MQPIRTLAEVEFEFSCLGRDLFKYQEIAPRVAKLAHLGMGDPDIARQLGVDTRTVKRGREWVGKGMDD